MSNIRLSGITGNYIAQKTRCDDHIIVLCRVLSVGNYTDMNGSAVPVDEKRLVSLATNYNIRLAAEFDKYKQSIMENKEELDSSIVAAADSMSIDEFDFLPNQVDHDLSSVHSTVGNVMGKMFLKKSLGKLAIFCYIKVKGEDNVKCVVSDKWRNLSAGFDMDTNKFSEISWVVYGADSNAQKVLGNSNLGTNKIFLSDNKLCGILLQCEDTVAKLQQKIWVKQRSIALCKKRKITQADRSYIELKLSKVSDLQAIADIFDILDEYIPLQKKHQIILMNREESNVLLDTLGAANNIKSYQNGV